MKKIMNQPDLGLLIFRLFLGGAMAWAHGLGKLPPPDKMIEGVTALGFPLPIVFAWAAALSEFLGGILIALGLFTRYSALFLGITMAVAGFIIHGQDPFSSKELAFFYLSGTVLLIFTGAGSYSLDKIIRKK